MAQGEIQTLNTSQITSQVAVDAFDTLYQGGRLRLYFESPLSDTAIMRSLGGDFLPDEMTFFDCRTTGNPSLPRYASLAR